MEYSIVIPVFNKAELTRNCLSTLQESLKDAGEGEIIVIDNASTDRTAEMLQEFPWATIVRNERNLGFAGANNQGARMAKGRFLVLLNNDTQAFPGWLRTMLDVAREPGVGAVGARLLFPNNTIQHAGVVVTNVLFGRMGVTPFHYDWKVPANDPDVLTRREYQVVTGACLVTPRDLYLELGGLDEVYWNGYEDVDYCFKVRARGLKVVYEPRATLYHFESQSGSQRFRKTAWNIAVLGERWNGKVHCDAALRNVEVGKFPVFLRDQVSGTLSTIIVRTPPVKVVVHGSCTPEQRRSLEREIGENRAPVESIRFCEAGDAIAVARDAMKVRGDHFVALVSAQSRLDPGWLDELIAQIGMPPNVAAVTFAPELPHRENVATPGCDARCTLLNLTAIPQHLELRDFDTIDGAVADLALRALALERAVRGARRAIGTVPPLVEDASFEAEWREPLRATLDADPEAIERRLRARPKKERGLVSIVTLSWNAPLFTQKALTSIRACTSEPYEVIVVDNGSGPDTVSMLRQIDDPHVRVIYNKTNRGFSGGNNDGIAAAQGEYVILLNNDVIVTEGWVDGLIDAFRRTPTVGVSAPRSNKVVGHQQLPTVSYQSEEAMAVFAAQRREEFSQRGYFADRAIGLCLCVDRKVLDTIGGLDERFGMGNFEDDDFCIRVRAAGYSIYVCDDVFIHHFGSQSFAANKVDYAATMQQNWSRFAAKWGYPQAFPENGYQPRFAYAQGFDPAKHFVEVRRNAEETAEWAESKPAAKLVFLSSVRDEAQWSKTAEFVKRFGRAFDSNDRMLLAIASFEGPPAETLATRVEKIFARAGVDPDRSPDVEVSDEDDAGEWRARFAGARIVEIEALIERSPSALRRLAEEVAE